MPHTLSAVDRAFRTDFEAGRVTPGAFDHRAHVRLAYVDLTESSAESALTRMRTALLAFPQRHGIAAC